MSDVKKSSDGLGTPLFLLLMILSTSEKTPKWILILLAIGFLAHVGKNIFDRIKASNMAKKVES
jgi:hypothetical protein